MRDDMRNTAYDYAVQLYVADVTAATLTAELLADHIEAGGGSRDDATEALVEAVRARMPAAIDIPALRAEAAAAGDLEMVAICDRAESGDADAIAECQRVVADADAMDDGCHDG